MPRPQRKPEEIEAFKEDILTQALELIVRDGFNGFSMRKLAARLDIAAKTIYNYFNNKDELYLAILTRGFEDLYGRCKAVFAAHDHPLDRLSAMVATYMDFGLDNVHFYNLMFTWHAPKYNDYIGTPMEATARAELDAALRVADLFTEAIGRAAEPVCRIDDAQARFLLVHSWSQLHGYVAGVNNHLLDYMTDNPALLKTRMQAQIVTNLQREFLFLKDRCSGDG
ncbi:MAG: TetR/AcrR family transcriptional regulator [Desulfobacterales bacterium]|nr:TetR/AcrR family transcriptional regulator [Desulfobacterales bacterium]